MQTKIFKKIVVTTDFSELSSSAIAYIQSFQAFSEATLFLVHVMEPARLVGLPVAEVPAEGILHDVDEDAAGEFAEYIRLNVPTSLSIDAIIRRGEPAKEIVQFASEINADLIVIATHGRTGLTHMLMGSVAERVIRSASVPVLTIKPLASRSGLQSELVENGDLVEQLHIEKREDE